MMNIDFNSLKAHCDEIDGLNVQIIFDLQFEDEKMRFSQIVILYMFLVFLFD